VVRAVLVSLWLIASPALADEPRTYVHGEVDPLTFANSGYGGQLGIRLPALDGVRVAIASFSLHVPDLVSQLGGNDGFHVRVRPSGALYVLYYFAPAGHDGVALGGSVRYLRIEYDHDSAPGVTANVSEISPEAIIGYQWHPFHNGFYLQPWLALGVALSHSAPAVVGTHTYNEAPVSPFATVNIGWERGL
jgi:hypothetical protein